MPTLNLIQGTLELLVLRVLAEEPRHGYAIAKRIHELSESLLKVEEGSLYPALYRMEQRGWVSSAWRKTETGRRARFYELTPDGAERLAEEQTQWAALSGAVNRVLEGAS